MSSSKFCNTRLAIGALVMSVMAACCSFYSAYKSYRLTAIVENHSNPLQTASNPGGDIVLRLVAEDDDSYALKPLDDAYRLQAVSIYWAPPFEHLLNVRTILDEPSFKVKKGALEHMAYERIAELIQGDKIFWPVPPILGKPDTFPAVKRRIPIIVDCIYSFENKVFFDRFEYSVVADFSIEEKSLSVALRDVQFDSRWDANLDEPPAFERLDATIRKEFGFPSS